MKYVGVMEPYVELLQTIKLLLDHTVLFSSQKLETNHQTNTQTSKQAHKQTKYKIN
jgi:hypothetical protein